MNAQVSKAILRRARPRDATPLKAAFTRSTSLHDPWVYPPADFERYANQPNLYLVCLADSDEIAGAFNISEIGRGPFQSAYLGFQAFSPYAGKGYMRQGLPMLLAEAFNTLALHRLEANIQPGNLRSIALVSQAGFQREGYSPKYLRIGNEWRDHERWAIINDTWEERDANT